MSASKYILALVEKAGCYKERHGERPTFQGFIMLDIMQSFLISLLVTVLAAETVVAASSTLGYHAISVDAGVVIGTLKNLQGTNNAKVRTLNPYDLLCSIHPNNHFLTLFRDIALSNDETDIIDDATAAVQTHWANSSVKHVMICENMIPN